MGAARRRARPRPARRPRGRRGRAHGRAGPLGRRHAGVGPARHLPGHRPRRRARPGAPGVVPGPAREGLRLVPARHAPDQRPLRHRAVDRVQRTPARLAGHPRHAGGRSGARAEQPGGGGRARCRRDGQDLRRRWSTRSAGSVRPQLSAEQALALAGAAPRAARAGRRSPGRCDSPTSRRRSASDSTTSTSTTPGASRRRSPPSGADTEWLDRAADQLPGEALTAGAALGRRHAVDDQRARARSATRPTASPSSCRRCAPTPRWTAPPPSGCRSPRGSTAPW